MNILCQLLFSFFQIGLFSIGGGYATIPLIQSQVVEKHGWITLTQMTDMITLSQMTPGPLAVNTSTFVGLRVAGIPGAVAATFGCVISGVLICLLLYLFFRKNKGVKSVSYVLEGLRSSSIGLIASAAGSILLLSLFRACSPSFKSLSPDLPAAALFVFFVFLSRKKKAGPIFIMALGASAGVIAALLGYSGNL